MACVPIPRGRIAGVWRILKLAARAAAWRTTPNPPLAGLPILLGYAAALAALRLTIQYFAAGGALHFNPYGFNAIVAGLALQLAVAALFIPPASRITALAAMLALSMVAELLIGVVAMKFPLSLPTSPADLSLVGVAAPMAAFAVIVIWWIGAVVALLRSFVLPRRLSLVGRVAVLWVCLLIADAVVPHAPVFLPPDFDIRTANLWELVRASGGALAASGELAKIEKAQPALLQAQIARLAPQRKGVTDIYALGIAGWADQDVFIKELYGGLESISSVLPIKDRTVRLINNRDTLGTVPLANLQNFTAAVHAIGDIMDKDEDILVLLMTSHGSDHGFMLQIPGAMTELTPQEVASTLDGAGIKNRVVIVSACYAGIFLPPLANDTTIVMTAADAKNTSFGCAPERDWTYFGDAFFRQSLHPGTDFENAFDHARILIQGWELMDHAQPSNPQAHFGPAVVGKLAPYFATNAGQ
jgi:Peptidase C13 family